MKIWTSNFFSAAYDSLLILIKLKRIFLYPIFKTAINLKTNAKPRLWILWIVLSSFLKLFLFHASQSWQISHLTTDRLTAYWLLDDCLMTTWWLSIDYLITAYWLLDDCLMTSWWLPADINFHSNGFFYYYYTGMAEGLKIWPPPRFRLPPFLLQ